MHTPSAPASPSASAPERPSILGMHPGVHGEQLRRLAQLAPCMVVLAAEAPLTDQVGALSARSLHALREAGLWQLALPARLGGGAADFATCALVAAELGRHCASTAMAFCAHAAPLLWMGAMEGVTEGAVDLSPEQRSVHPEHEAQHARRVVQQGAVYAQALSDPTACASGATSHSVLARKVEGGYRLNGRKSAVALVGVADYHVLLCTLDRPGATLHDTLLLAVAVDLPGVALDRVHAPTGLRGLAAGALVLRDVFVPEAERLLPPGVVAEVAGRCPHLHLLASAPLLGIAQGAYDATLECLQGGGAAAHGPAPRRDNHALHTVARMKLLLEQARAVWLSAVMHAQDTPAQDMHGALLVACHAVAHHTLSICSLALQASGVPGQDRACPLERMLRDAHSLCAWLPWSLESSLERLGRECLATPGRMREPDVL